MDLSELLMKFLTATIPVGGGVLLVREVVGNVFGLASALLGMQRRVAAWPIGIIGNVLLFTVFAGGAIGGVLGTPQDSTLWGQAGRQIFFVIVSVYGWIRWAQFRKSGGGKAGVAPKWAGWKGRIQLIVAFAVLWVALYFTFKAVGSWGAAVEAWILTGSILATYGMARGYVEFWLIWIAVDAVGVPTLIKAGYYPTATMYVVYGVFCLIGFISWLRLERKERDAESVAASNPIIEAVG